MKGIGVESNDGVGQDGFPAFEEPGTLDETQNVRKLMERKFTWHARGQHRDRLGWLILSSVFQTFVAVPVTLITARLNETQNVLYIPCGVAFLVTQIINFAGLSTKTIILAFYAGIAVDIGVIALSFIV